MGASSTVPRRDRILASAEREFARHGSAGARMDRIAAEAGVNKQLLFHYFGSKAGLHQAVVESVAVRLDLSATGRTPAERLRVLLAQLLLAAADYQTLLSADWRASAADRAAQIIKDGQRQGYYRDDVDPMALAKLITAASFGWPAVVGRAGDGAQDELLDSFGAFIATVVSDYCTWR